MVVRCYSGSNQRAAITASWVRFSRSNWLGTSPVWSGYVLTIHTVWSILVPIVLTEQLFRTRVRTPVLIRPVAGEGHAGGVPSPAATAALTAICSGLFMGFTVQFYVHGFAVAGLVAQLAFVAIAVALLLGAWRRQGGARPASRS